MIAALQPHAAELVAMALLLVGATLGGFLVLERQSARRARLARYFGEEVVLAQEPTGLAWGMRWLQRIGVFLLHNAAVGAGEGDKLSTLLLAAGLRQEGILPIVFGLKALGAVALPPVAFVLVGEVWHFGLLFKLASLPAGCLLGWRLPDVIIDMIARRRRAAIEDGLPDVLDLVVICAEAGLSLEQALERVGRELRLARPVLAEELMLVVAEMRMLSDRTRALENFANRSGLASVRSIVGTLTQTLRYGTPLAQSLRVIAAEMRKAQTLRIESRAARLPVALTVPLILFILPCLIVVIAGPGALQVMNYMH